MLEAERLLSNPPAKYDGAWQGKAQKARQALAEAKRTKCFFHFNGGCRDGAMCRFLHSAASVPSGRIRKWLPHAPRGAIAFVELVSGENLFAPAGNFVGTGLHSIREGLEVRVLDIGEAPNSGMLRIARRVEPD